jgi:hypothetical protein
MRASKIPDRKYQLIKRSISCVGAMLLAVTASANATNSTDSTKTAIANNDIFIAQSYCPSKLQNVYHLEKTIGRATGVIEMGTQIALLLETDSSTPTTMQRFYFSPREGMDWKALLGRRLLIAQMVCDSVPPNVLPHSKTSP